MPTIIIDNRPYQVASGLNLLEACLSLGLNLPYFCWHPALGSVGACRQCAIRLFRDESDQRGRIVMACMTPAEEGVRLSIHDPEAVAFRARVIEWLMVNHPHDCPVCDEGGECHLQDMTVMTGHTYRRFSFAKRTYQSQYLGPFIHHEMNRCIQCYRCVRFYHDYAGGRDLNVFGCHDHLFFGRHREGILESEFSGNLVEVCPTGVFTDKTLREHYTRKWDLSSAPSLCLHCALGCNILVQERYGTVRRIRNRYHHEVNGYFICDRGRYGYGFLNGPHRIRAPRLRLRGQAQPLTLKEALERLAPLLKGRVMAIGSPRASLEANFALKTLVGPERFFSGLAGPEARLIDRARAILEGGPARSPSLRDVSLADGVLVLGADLTNEAPRLDLALRQAVRQAPLREAVERVKVPAWSDGAMRDVIQGRRGPLYIVSPAGTKLDEISTQAIRAVPEEVARLAHAVAHNLDGMAPGPMDLPGDRSSLAREIAEALRTAQRPLVVVGLGLGSEAVLMAAANVAWALCRVRGAADLAVVMAEPNGFGLSLLGGRPLEEALVEGEPEDVVILLENDLYRRAPAPAIDRFLARVGHLIALDSLEGPTTTKAHMVLPVATFAESSGTMVSSEGRAQRYFRVMPPPGDVQAAWRWIRDMMVAQGRAGEADWRSLDDVIQAMVEKCPTLAPVRDIAPRASFRIVGQRVAREPWRYSGRTAMTAQASVHEPRPPSDPDSPLSFSMEGTSRQPPSPLIPEYWAPGWNSVQALNKFQEEVGGPLRGGDPGRRLIEPAQPEEVGYFSEVPGPFVPREGRWWIFPVYHIFGSEEHSALSPPVAERVGGAYLLMSPEDGAGLGVGDGEVVDLHLADMTLSLPLRLAAGVPLGAAGVPVGLGEVRGLILPAWARVALRGGL